MAPETLEARARHAYEWGRAWHGLRAAVTVLPLVVLSSLGCGRSTATIAFGAALFGVVTTLRWRGEAAGRAVVPGMLAGVLPLVAPIAAKLSGHCCLGLSCGVFMSACLGGGALCGALVGWRLGRRGAGSRELALTLVVAGLTGAMGCVSGGLSGVLGMVAGIVLGAAPGLLLVRRA
jgi:hypothetical protein